MNVFVRFGLTGLCVFLLSGSFADAYEEQWGYVQVREVSKPLLSTLHCISVYQSSH